MVAHILLRYAGKRPWLYSDSTDLDLWEIFVDVHVKVKALDLPIN